MRATMKMALVIGAVGLGFALFGGREASATARVTHGPGGKVMALIYYVDQAGLETYLSTVHSPLPGVLARLIFDVHKTGTGVGEMVIGVRRVLAGDAGYSAPICQVTVPCTAPVGPTGHYHSDAGYECDAGAEVTDEELLAVELLSSTCGVKPDGHVTLYFEF